MPSTQSSSNSNDDVTDDSDCSIISIEDDEDDVETISNDDGVADLTKSIACPSISWTGFGKKVPVLIFKPDAVVCKMPDLKAIGEKYHLAFKIVKTECKLVRSIFTNHGFHEVHQNSSDFNMMWTGSHLKPYVLRTLFEFQKVNHFPRSYEITRKDRLFKNIQRMQQLKGYRNFDFVSQSFVIPAEFQEFCAASYKEKSLWIIKPTASSRGRGIYLVTAPDQVPLEDNVVVCRYISNPFLIDGFKFDLRLYVAVTSYDPLLIYLYEEGLTRFATVKFDKSLRTIGNNCMHLTNYSVNKKSSDYVSNDDPDVEDFGNKWSLGALLRYLKAHGRDTTALMMSIEDVIIKTLISAELSIASACKMFMPFKGNCFELFGFDILIDESLRPWVLEVNLSPSLACDAPLDLKIKSNMVSDLLSLVGVECHDPMTRKPSFEGTWNAKIRPNIRAQSAKPLARTALLHKKACWWRKRVALRQKRKRPESAVVGAAKAKTGVGNAAVNSLGHTSEEAKVLRRAKEEHARRGGWVRIFPTPDTWESYSSFLQYSTNLNSFLHQNLFQDGLSEQKPAKKHKLHHLHSTPNSQLAAELQNNMALTRAMRRSKQYERKLTCLSRHSGKKSTTSKPADEFVATQTSNAVAAIGSSKSGTLVQGRVIDADSNAVPNRSQSLGTVVKNDVVPMSKHRTEPTYNVVKLLEKGMTMSKVQARFAFATYLTCIKDRLVDETNKKQNGDLDSANEQMELVLRFLQRAANNLQQPFKVTVPSSKLSINDRRSLLAKQLHEFLRIYDKETEQLKQRIAAEKNQAIVPDNLLDEQNFNKFVTHASENELEEVLTIYTKMSKSSSIFLRSSSQQISNDQSTAGRSTSNQRSVSDDQASRSTSNQKRHSQNASANQQSANSNESESKHVGSIHTNVGPNSLENSSHGNSSHGSNNQASSQHSISNLGNVGSHGTVAGIPPLPGGMASRHGSTLSSYASAVTIYSAKLGSIYPGLKHRPISASSQGSAASGTSQKSRPISAVASEERLSGQKDSANDQISVALQRLALRQRNRQYCANRSNNLLSNGHVGDAIDKDSGDHRNICKNGLYRRVRQSSVDHFRDLEKDELNDKSKSSGFARQSSTQSLSESAQYGPDASESRSRPAFNTVEYYQSQQSMIEQSRMLLEESKAKHHALVAQAHSMQKQLRKSRDDNKTGLCFNFTPKPPPMKPTSDKKAAQSRGHRLVRATSVEDTRTSIDQCEYSFDFE